MFITKSSFLTVFIHKILVTLANSAYPDQTAHGAVSSGPALFAYNFLLGNYHL